ncbi:MAG: hypothetical protein KIT72_01135 [Polyangiaceae bacterium]|nr:hypothetical protein [Polyangiaceae bacterium]MCW5788999.1 hypothetical protein [Polyangiaceae bacterium]
MGSALVSAERRVTWLLRGLPVLAVLAVGFALLVVGGERAYVAARLFGGPMEDAASYHVRLAVAEHARGEERPRELPVRVTATTDAGQVAEVDAVTDALGHAEIELRFEAPTTGPLAVRVEVAEDQPGLSRGHPLAAGRVHATLAAWQAGLRRGATWSGQSRGELALRVAPGRGAFAVPFRDTLWIEVTRGDRPVAGSHVEVRLTGATLAIDGEEGGRSRQLMSDERGLASTELIADAHTILVDVSARLEQPEGEALTGSISATLPVVPGAIDLRPGLNDSLVLTSPVEREHAFVAWIDERRRWGGASVPLTPSPDGLWRGALTLPSRAEGQPPGWLLTSSSPELQGGGSVGWPLDDPSAGPLPTLGAAELALLDGFPEARARAEVRVRRARWIAAGIALVSGLIVIALMVEQSRRSAARFNEHLKEQASAEAQASLEVAPIGLSLIIAALCIGLGFLLLGLLVLYRGA